MAIQDCQDQMPTRWNLDAHVSFPVHTEPLHPSHVHTTMLMLVCKTECSLNSLLTLITGHTYINGMSTYFCSWIKAWCSNSSPGSHSPWWTHQCMGATISELVLKKKEVIGVPMTGFYRTSSTVRDLWMCSKTLKQSRTVLGRSSQTGTWQFPRSADEVGTLLRDEGGHHQWVEAGAEGALRLALSIATPAGAAVATGVANGIEFGVETGTTVALLFGGAIVWRKTGL